MLQAGAPGSLWHENRHPACFQKTTAPHVAYPEKGNGDVRREAVTAGAFHWTRRFLVVIGSAPELPELTFVEETGTGHARDQG